MKSRRSRSDHDAVLSRPPGGQERQALGVSSGATTAAQIPARESRRSGPSAIFENHVVLGEFGRPHGLKGEVRLKSFTADPLAIAGYGPLLADDGRTIVITEVRPAPGGAADLLITRVRDVASREAAEALNRVRVHVERERLGQPEEEDEFLLADLIGLEVFDPSGVALGTVVAVPNYGGGDLLEIAPVPAASSVLVPFTKAFVPQVDLGAKRIVVDAPDLFAGEES